MLTARTNWSQSSIHNNSSFHTLNSFTFFHSFFTCLKVCVRSVTCTSIGKKTYTCFLLEHINTKSFIFRSMVTLSFQHSYHFQWALQKWKCQLYLLVFISDLFKLCIVTQIWEIRKCFSRLCCVFRWDNRHILTDIFLKRYLLKFAKW